MKTYKIPVSWSVSSTMRVEAESLVDALGIAMSAPLPSDGDYLDDTFAVDREFLEAVNEEDPEILTEIAIEGFLI